jgi:hypothetical protein
VAEPRRSGSPILRQVAAREQTLDDRGRPRSPCGPQSSSVIRWDERVFPTQSRTLRAIRSTARGLVAQSRHSKPPGTVSRRCRRCQTPECDAFGIFGRGHGALGRRRSVLTVARCGR